jgi:hypothetical protein
VIEVARRKGKTFVELKRLARDRIAFTKWTEDPMLQGNRDEVLVEKFTVGRHP